MPTVSQVFQPPLYWQQFEDLACGMLGEVYNIPDPQQYGRPGQAQKGVDVYGKSTKYGWIGVQCKRLADYDKNGIALPGGPITKTFFLNAAEEALSFKPNLSVWILATTARRTPRYKTGLINLMTSGQRVTLVAAQLYGLGTTASLTSTAFRNCSAGTTRKLLRFTGQVTLIE